MSHFERNWQGVWFATPHETLGGLASFGRAQCSLSAVRGLKIANCKLAIGNFQLTSFS